MGETSFYDNKIIVIQVSSRDDAERPDSYYCFQYLCSGGNENSEPYWLDKLTDRSLHTRTHPRFVKK